MGSRGLKKTAPVRRRRSTWRLLSGRNLLMTRHYATTVRLCQERRAARLKIRHRRPSACAVRPTLQSWSSPGADDCEGGPKIQIVSSRRTISQMHSISFYNTQGHLTRGRERSPLRYSMPTCRCCTYLRTHDPRRISVVEITDSAPP